MSQLATTKRITTIGEAEGQFNLVRAAEPNFFPEGRENLLDLTDAEKAILDRVRARYRYHRAQGHLVFSRMPLQNELYDVLQILKGLAKNVDVLDTS